MPSIIEGYNYDIFISYRQKDNKGDRWVSEFVEALKTELESTFKEEISVYFDINPHDGLLETHDVDESLKDKLKCLVFIPIISRTYCDPKSFAWEREFKAFVELASKDQLGLKVRLPNRNVASRVLPVRIHDMDIEDVKLIEGVTGGVMRTMDFVFKTASGVNRPLKSREDHPGDNLNKTYYQDQINKVALAIKEIVQGMKTEPSLVDKVKDRSDESFKEIKKDVKIDFEPHTNSGKWKLLSKIIIVAILIIVSVFAYPKIFKRDTLEKLHSSGERISIAVMPFQNMTNDTIWNIWQDAIQDILITSLSNSEELIIRQNETVNTLIKNSDLSNYAALTPSLANKISKKLEVDFFILGKILLIGSDIRFNAQLFDSKTNVIYKSFQIEGNKEKAGYLVDSLSRIINNFLVISKINKNTYLHKLYQQPESLSAKDLAAFKLLNDAAKATRKLDYNTAINLSLEAIAIDSNYIQAKTNLIGNYIDNGMYDKAKQLCLKVYAIKDQIPLQFRIIINFQYAFLFESHYEQIKYLKQLQEFDNQLPDSYMELGWAYQKLLMYDDAIQQFETALEIYDKWNLKPFWCFNYTFLGEIYHKEGLYKKEENLYKRAEQDFPNYSELLYRQAIWALSKKKIEEADEYITKYKNLLKENSATDADIATGLAGIYYEASITDKAEEYYRQALSLEPESSYRMNQLASFLIDKDRKMNEGLELVDRALVLTPDDYTYLDTKGWGLYKQGKFIEALQILQKSWDLRMKNAIYDHSAFLHLEEAKKAVANQK